MRKLYETARFKVLETDENDAVRCSDGTYDIAPYALENTLDLKDVYSFSWLSKLSGARKNRGRIKTDENERKTYNGHGGVGGNFGAYRFIIYSGKYG